MAKKKINDDTLLQLIRDGNSPAELETRIGRKCEIEGKQGKVKRNDSLRNFPEEFDMEFGHVVESTFFNPVNPVNPVKISEFGVRQEFESTSVSFKVSRSASSIWRISDSHPGATAIETSPRVESTVDTTAKPGYASMMNLR
ncbi:MAG: hypothetical protein WAN11_01415 [Syntrophobacteraceae bacterium]